MRRLRRPAGEPDALLHNRVSWEERYAREVDAARQAGRSPPRPPSKTYNHPGVRQVLRAMSDCKCFYCERQLRVEEERVDHYLEVVDHPGLAFTWRNLYLACDGCNGRKLPDRTHPAADCVDPCGAGEPRDRVEFVGFHARGRDAVGDATVKKYDLDREGLCILRADYLAAFQQRYATQLARCVLSGASALTAEERAELARWMDPRMPYSEMMRAWLGPLLTGGGG